MYMCGFMCFLFGFWLLFTFIIGYLHVAFSVHEKFNVQLKLQEKGFLIELWKDLFYLVLHHGRMEWLVIILVYLIKVSHVANKSCLCDTLCIQLIYLSFEPHKPFHKLYNPLKLCLVYFVTFSQFIEKWK